MSVPYLPSEKSEHVRSVVRDLVFTILTFGFFNLYVQYRQMAALNALLMETRYRFWPWLFWTILTFGLYHVYHEYRRGEDLKGLLKRPTRYEPVAALVLTLVGFGIVTDCIHQYLINSCYGVRSI